MTLTLHWWYVPIVLVIVAVAVPVLLMRNADTWDPVSPLVSIAVFVGCLGMALAFVIGRLFA